MSPFVLFVALVSGTLISQIAAAATLTTEATPSHIHPLLTKKLHLRCAVRNDGGLDKSQDTSTPASELTKSLISNLSKLVDPNPPSSVRAITSDSSIANLLSVVVTKINEDTGLNETVASVTGCNFPKIEGKFTSTLEVEGNSEGSDREGELGYLLLTWDRPVDGHAGNFTCEVNALNSDKHPVFLNVSLEITSREPRIADLTKYIYARETEILSLQSEMTRENAALREEIAQLISNTTKSETKVQRQKAQNIQAGTLSCHEDTGTIFFTKPYTNPPIVFLSTIGLEIRSHRSSAQVSVQSITHTDFTYTCSNINYDQTFSWLAIDN